MGPILQVSVLASARCLFVIVSINSHLKSPTFYDTLVFSVCGEKLWIGEYVYNPDVYNQLVRCFHVFHPKQDMR